VDNNIASREMGVNGRTDRQPENTMPLAGYCWRRRHENGVRPITVKWSQSPWS